MGYIIPSASYVGGHGFQIWQTAVCTVQNVQVILCSMIDRLYNAINDTPAQYSRIEVLYAIEG